MNGLQIIENCRSIAQRQYEGDAAGAAQHEIELLRTKVLELSKQLADRDDPPGVWVPIGVPDLAEFVPAGEECSANVRAAQLEAAHG
jgi:hypothetical protein